MLVQITTINVARRYSHPVRLRQPELIRGYLAAWTVLTPLHAPSPSDTDFIAAAATGFLGRAARRALLQEPLPRRWAHVQGVASRVRSLAPGLGADADLLEAAAWLHDIGYAPSLATTGMHALDGARYLRDAQHAHGMLCRLVAHHSCAIIEAEERGLADALGLEFEPAPQALSSALTYCDMTTSPDGEPVPVGEPGDSPRYMHRYGPGHLVSRSIRRATPMILRAVEQAQGQSRPDRIAPAGPEDGHDASTILVSAGAGSNWLPKWRPEACSISSN